MTKDIDTEDVLTVFKQQLSTSLLPVHNIPWVDSIHYTDIALLCSTAKYVLQHFPPASYVKQLKKIEETLSDLNVILDHEYNSYAKLIGEHDPRLRTVETQSPFAKLIRIYKVINSDVQQIIEAFNDPAWKEIVTLLSAIEDNLKECYENAFSEENEFADEFEALLGTLRENLTKLDECIKKVSWFRQLWGAAIRQIEAIEESEYFEGVISSTGVRRDSAIIRSIHLYRLANTIEVLEFSVGKILRAFCKNGFDEIDVRGWFDRRVIDFNSANNVWTHD